MCTNGTQVPCEVPSLRNPTTPKGWPHHRGLRPLLFSNSGVGSFTSRKNKSVQVLWDGTYGFSSLSEKTRKSNHLQMSLQRQHFLLSYLKTLSVGPAGVWTRDLPLGRPALSQLSLQAAVKCVLRDARHEFCVFGDSNASGTQETKGNKITEHVGQIIWNYSKNPVLNQRIGVITDF